MYVTELRKESRRLEVEIDLKLISFGKLGSSYAQRESKCVIIGPPLIIAVDCFVFFNTLQS